MAYFDPSYRFPPLLLTAGNGLVYPPSILDLLTRVPIRNLIFANLSMTDIGNLHVTAQCITFALHALKKLETMKGKTDLWFWVSGEVNWRLASRALLHGRQGCQALLDRDRIGFLERLLHVYRPVVAVCRGCRLAKCDLCINPPIPFPRPTPNWLNFYTHGYRRRICFVCTRKAIRGALCDCDNMHPPFLCHNCLGRSNYQFSTKDVELNCGCCGNVLAREECRTDGIRWGWCMWCGKGKCCGEWDLKTPKWL